MAIVVRGGVLTSGRRGRSSASNSKRLALFSKRGLVPVCSVRSYRAERSLNVGTNNREKNAFTKLQGQYLAYIAMYTRLHRRPPAEADLQNFFGVTPPSVHDMILTLEKRGLISRTPSRARSIEVLVPQEQLPTLE